jgi:hypothetical protein
MEVDSGRELLHIDAIGVFHPVNHLKLERASYAPLGSFHAPPNASA